MPRVSAAELRQAKETALAAIAAGKTVKDACAAAGRSMKTFEGWRANDPDFARRVDEVREAFRSRGAGGGAVEVGAARDISFEDFRKEYLGQETYAHHRAWIQAIETGEVDPDLPGEFKESRPNRILINTPPFHSKSTVITQEYVLYRVCMNPNVRILIISKTQVLARTFLYWIKQRLTDPRWARLQAAFGPQGGFRANEGEWSANRIYVAGGDSEQKDPTVQALGIGTQVYGTRADLAILDDVSDTGNSHQFESQIRYLEQDVMSRLSSGKIIVVGTRTGLQDIYSELTRDDRYMSGKSPWSYLRQPAVLQFAPEPEDWVTLWPRSARPLDENGEDTPGEDGLFPAWDGVRLEREVRSSVAPGRWALVYMQSPLSDNVIFSPVCVHGSVNRRRKPGPLTAGAWGSPRAGKEGMYTIASMDPAMSGDTFTVVESVDRVSRKRFVENAWVETAPSPNYIRGLIRQVTEEYNVHEWVIESNAFQLFLVHDPEIRTYLSSKGVRLTPHYTSGNKQDPDFGVASLAPLFGSSRRINDGAGREVHEGDNLLELPDPDYSVGVKTLVEELLIWEPGKRGKDLRMDGPMALWFAELRARNILGMETASTGRTQNYMKNPFLTRRDARERAVVPAHLLEGGSYVR